MPEDSLTAAGGYCVPTTVMYDVIALEERGRTVPRLTLPEVRVPRGGITYEVDYSPEAAAAAETRRALINRMASRMLAQRHAAVEAAIYTAVDEGWDVHVYDPPEPFYIYHSTDADLLRLRCVGIAFTEQKWPGAPTVHEHGGPPDGWEFMDDEDYWP